MWISHSDKMFNLNQVSHIEKDDDKEITVYTSFAEEYIQLRYKSKADRDTAYSKLKNLISTSQNGITEI